MKVNIYTDFIKLDSLLKLSGAASDGAQAKQMIAAGAVKVNGETCTMRGKKLYPGDKVCLLQTAEADGELYEVCAEE